MTAAVVPSPRCGNTTDLFVSRAWDRDRLLVLTLAVILVQNRASIELILALLYIAM